MLEGYTLFYSAAMKEEVIAYVDPDLRDLIPNFLGGIHRDVGIIRTSAANADYAVIKSLAHNMKGAGGSYGFKPTS